ncbi:hypothetical protein FKM82_004737 [Ascaphus truei]
MGWGTLLYHPYSSLSEPSWFVLRSHSTTEGFYHNWAWILCLSSLAHCNSCHTMPTADHMKAAIFTAPGHFGRFWFTFVSMLHVLLTLGRPLSPQQLHQWNQPRFAVHYKLQYLGPVAVPFGVQCPFEIQLYYCYICGLHVHLLADHVYLKYLLLHFGSISHCTKRPAYPLT